MKMKNKTDRYQSPATDQFRTLPDLLCESSDEVETLTPDDWDEGNTDWWNS